MIKLNEISIINIDIDGNEEHIFEELIGFNKKYSIPIIIKVYFNISTNTNINCEKYSLIDKKSNVYLIK